MVNGVQMPGQGDIWLQGYQSNANAVVKNVDTNTGAFGIYADAVLNAEQNLFNIATNGIGIAWDTAFGSVVHDNVIVASNGGAGSIGYLVGYNNNVSTNTCVTGDTFELRADLTTPGDNAATKVQACAHALVRQNGAYLPTILSSNPACSAATEGQIGRATDCASTTVGTTCAGGNSTHAAITCNGTNWVQMGF
jgi:hypothetical protein